jgi:lipoate-protein ligase A
MAIDTYFAQHCSEEMDPILRFYGWKPPCLSIGYHQNSNIINLKKLKQDGFQFVRRPTGGRAIFHSEELTYSIVIHKNLMHHKELYKLIHIVLRGALQSLGYAVEIKETKSLLPRIKTDPSDFPCFTQSAYSEIHYKGRKLVGSAQKIYKSAILQHGSLLIGPAHERLSEYLKDSDANKGLIRSDIKDKTVCLNSIAALAISPEKVMHTIIKQLELNEMISVYFKSLHLSELQQARRIEIDSE